MTLQQKLLAKQSKKGFTLVELVVVIAILGILAAIAIPAVIGIISSANESQAKSDASSVNTACKNMYAEIVAGTINASNKGSITTKITTSNKKADTTTGLPVANAAASDRKAIALDATVQQALEYAGLTSLKDKVGDFVYDAKGDGTIYANVDQAKGTAKDGKWTPVTTATTMTALCYK